MPSVTNQPFTTRRPAAPATRAIRRRRSDEAIRQLVARAVDGDECAWRELVEEFGGLVWGVARGCGLTDADAADVCQITWQRLVEHIGRLHDPARVGAWLATTARRQCIALYSSSRPLPVGDELPEIVADAPPPEARLVTRERDELLWAALADVSLDDRLLLRVLMSDPKPSYADVSEALDMPIGSIGPTRARALVRLRRAARRHGLRDNDW